MNSSKKTYKDLNPKDALVLRFFEIATIKAHKILDADGFGYPSKKNVMHAAWVYRKYLYSLPKNYSFLRNCYIYFEDGNTYSVTEVQDNFLDKLQKAKGMTPIVDSIIGGTWAYQALNYTIGVVEWGTEFNRLFKSETWNWKNDLTLTKVSPAEAEGKEQKYVHVEFLNKPDQNPVILRRIGPFTKYVYRYSEAFDAKTFEPVDISNLKVVRMRPRSANDAECDRLYS